jgi:hypothetical protein
MLTTRQMDVLRAAVDRIIPPDDFPGGWEGGVGSYLRGQFERDLKAILPTYAAGLDSLEAEATSVYNLTFDQLSTEQQDEMLTDVEAGKVTTIWLVDPILFFTMLTNHCAEGYYSDPGNGGNHGEIAWKMIGFEVNDDPL